MKLTWLRSGVRGAQTSLCDWSRKQDGLESVEWVLLIAGGVVPLATIVFKVMQAVVFYYEVTSWGVSLPFP